MTELPAKIKDNSPFDIDHWEQLNTGENGAYFFQDHRTNEIYSSDHSLSDLREYRLRLMKERGLGLAPLVVPLISLIGTAGGGLLSFFGKKQDNKTAQSNAEAQMTIAQIQAQQKAQQSAMIQQLATYGLIAFGGIALIMVLK